MQKETINLGFENGWGSKTPQILQDALDRGFKEEEIYNNGRGYHKYRVETEDKILEYSCDSSD